MVLPNVTEVKDLGIIVDHELKFKRHIQDVAVQVTYVRPLLDYYNCQVWSPCYV